MSELTSIQSLPAKQISQLTETVNLNTKEDYMPVNVWTPNVGHVLTKKVTIANLAQNIIEKLIKPQLSNDYDLKELAHETTESLLNNFMSKTHGGIGSMSLALSSVEDLNLGDLSGLNLADLHLERFAEKSYATGSFVTQPDEYINGIVQYDGKIVQVKTGNFADAVPIDSAIDATSQHAVQNAVIKAELDKKVTANDVNASFAPLEGRYVAGLTQVNGKITALHTYQLPKQPIDSVLDSSSKNPVENRVVKSAIESLGSKLESDVDAAYVKLTDANAYFKAPAGKFITAIRQTNGKIVGIETSDFDGLFANLEKKINDLIAQYENKIASLESEIDKKYLKLNYAPHQTVTGPVTFNSKISGSITNADQAEKAKWS